MTIKQKFSSIDQSKLTADQKSFLDKIKNVTKNFTDAEMNKKVEQPLDNFISKAKDKMPEAIKSAPVKRTAKAKSSQTRKPKRTAMSLAKEIRKEGESWNEARARASKMMKEDSKDLSKTVESELDKLSKLVKSQKERKKLSGLSGTNIKRDSVRKAKPKGRRISKDGNVYYENRDNRTDRLAPNYPKNSPFLAEGGYLTDPTFGNFQNQVFAEGGDVDAFTLRMVKSNGMQPAEMLKEDTNVRYNKGGSVTTERRYVNKDEDYEVRYSRPILRRKGYQGKRDFAGGGRVESLTKELHRLQRELNSSRLQTYRLGDVSQEAIDRKNEREVKLARFNEVLKELRQTDAKFELGGVMATDLAGHTGGSFGTGNPSLLSGVSGTHYTGLVGETGAMSSGEMFMNGGGLPSGAEQSYMIVDSFGNPAQHYARGGSVTNERKHVNHDEDYEVRYAKPRPSRKGYKGARSFSRGGLLGQSAKVKFLSEEFASLDLIDELKSKLKTEKNNVEDKDVIAFAYTDYGGDILDKYAIEYFLENHPNNIVVEPTSYYGKNAFVFGKPAKEWMKETEDYPLGFEDFESYFYEKENEDFEEGVNYFIKDLERDYSFNEDEVRDALLEQFSGYFSVGTSGLDYSEDVMIKYLKENDLIKEEYNRGGALRNERLHVNHDEDYEVRYAKPRPSRKGYKGARKFMAGGINKETPRIYVADLEAYNNGRLVGEWLDLSDYNDADELMDAIQDVLKKSGGEEYAIHDVEYVPRSMYSEYMGKRDFEELYEMMDLAKDKDLPLEVVQDVVSQYDASAVDEFYGKFDSADDFAYQLVEDIGIESFTDFQRYLTVSETDRRLLSQEMADSYVDDIRDEDGGNRLIEEARMDVSEYEEADNQTQEEMLDKAREIVYNEYYDNYFEGLSDPYYFLVEEQGIYSADDFAKANFVQVDYEDLGDALEDDYTYIFYNSDLYVFNIR